MARELAPYRIRVNAVAPGVTNTAMPRLGTTEEGLAELAQRLPTGRIAEPEDIADVIVFLATDDARHIIGQRNCRLCPLSGRCPAWASS